MPQFKDLHLLTSPPDSEFSRWSHALVSPPALILHPRSEQDVQSAILFAKRNNLQIVPACGSHGTFTPIGPQTLYLDLRNFKSIDLDASSGLVRVGGGVQTGELIAHLAERGHFTAVPNSNAVGIAGAILGGGNSSQNGIMGWMADNVLSFRVVTSSGSIQDVSPSSSSADQLSLYNALCGAGHGLCIITSLTMPARPLSTLSLTDHHKIWSRTLLFPPSALPSATAAFLSFNPPPRPMNLILGFGRSPPGSPGAGSPIVILSSTYYGPSLDAEAAAATTLFHPDLLNKTIKDFNLPQPFANQNDAFEPANVHGGYKSLAAARLSSITPESIQDALTRWLSLSESSPDATRTTLFFHNYNTSAAVANGASPEGKAKFIECRDRGISALVTAWCTNPETQPALASFIDDVLSICRRADTAAGIVPRSFPNNMQPSHGLDQLFPEERLAELKRLKKVWDSDGVFWSPYQR